jgi:hypothetical protein
MARAAQDRRGAVGVALFPLPFQGHISPMLQLAGVLHAQGLAVTVLHTAFNAPEPARHPAFSFVEVADEIPTHVARNVIALNAAMEASGSVSDALASLLAVEDHQRPRLACLVIDSILPAAQKAAASLGLPTQAARPASVCSGPTTCSTTRAICQRQVCTSKKNSENPNNKFSEITTLEEERLFTYTCMIISFTYT